MSDLIEAASAIRQIAVKLKGFELAAEALERVGSFEQAEAEAKAAAEKAKAEAALALADLDAARKDAEKMRTDGEMAKALGINDADRIRREAAEEGAKLVSDAQAEAERIIEQGRSKAAEHMRNVLDQVEAAEKKLEEVTARGVERERALIAAENALAATEAKLAKAREQIESLLKG